MNDDKLVETLSKINNKLDYLNISVNKVMKKVDKFNPTIEEKPEELFIFEKLPILYCIQELGEEFIYDCYTKQKITIDYQLVKQLYTKNGNMRCPWKWTTNNSRTMYYWDGKEWIRTNGKECCLMLVDTLSKIYLKVLCEKYKKKEIDCDLYTCLQNYQNTFHKPAYQSQFIKLMHDELI